MAGKHEHLILSDLIVPDNVAARMDDYNKRATRILWLEDFVIKGAPSIITSWYWAPTDEEGTPQHTHDFDEVVGFFGSDTDNPSDLCGEVEFWLEDEKYTLTKSCMIYCPAGLKHCPLRVVRADKPIFFLAVSLTSNYVKDNIVPGVK